MFSQVDETQLPVFVYGTLRHGQENYWFLRGRTVYEMPAVIEQMTLYALPSYPMMLEGDSPVHGELMILHPRTYTAALADLDELEGYQPGQGCLFFREERGVISASGKQHRAWVYMGNPDELTRHHHTPIPHGDWIKYRHDLIRGLKEGR